MEKENGSPRIRIPCAASGCHGQAAWIPALVLTPYEADRTGLEHTRAEMNLPFCTACKNKLTIDEFLTDEVWGHMCDKFTALGKILPERMQIDLDFKHFEWGYVH